MTFPLDLGVQSHAMVKKLKFVRKTDLISDGVCQKIVGTMTTATTKSGCRGGTKNT